MRGLVVMAWTWALLGAGCSTDDESMPRRPFGGTPAASGTGGVGPGGAGVPSGGVMGGMIMPPPTGGATPPPTTGGMDVTSTGGTGSTVGNGGTFDAGSDPARNMVAAGAICARLAQIQCAGEAFCCSAAGRDRATCESAQMSICADEAFVDAVSLDGASAFDASHAKNVVDELERLASLCDPTIASFAATTQGLVGIFKGTRGPGSPCKPQGLIPGARDVAIAVASCSSIETTACMPAGADPLGNWSCAAKSPAGGSCLTDLNCQAGMYCNNPALAAGNFGLGTCAARKVDGSPCGAGNECTSIICTGGTCAAAEAEAAYCLTQQI